MHKLLEKLAYGLLKLKFLLLILAFMGGCANKNSNMDISDAAKLSEVLSAINHKNITIIAPSSVRKNDMDILEIIEKYPNIEILVDPTALINKHENIEKIFHSDLDVNRFKYLKKALMNEKNDIIWTIRGGYGSAKVVEMLYKDSEFMNHMRNRKAPYPLVIGYSDITALHLFLSQEFRWQIAHGSMFREIAVQDKSEKNLDILLRIINKYPNPFYIKIKNLVPLNKTALSQKHLFGKLTGGNLSIIQTSIGTKWQIKTDGKILFLEDVNVKPYQIDRMLYHLLQVGLLKDVTAIVFGNFGEEKDELIYRTITAFAEKSKIPMYKTNLFGHDYYNIPMIYNSDVDIYIQPIDKKASLIQRIFRRS